MSIQNGKDYLYLIWKGPVSREQYIVGRLAKNGQYEFSYMADNVKKAQENDGYTPLICFPDVDKTYTSERLFPVFASRLPDPKRKDIDKILEKYALSEYDAYALLKASGTRLPIDTYEFIDPLVEDITKSVQRKFLLAGPRYYLGCDGTCCDNAIEVERGEAVVLKREPDNPKDEFAVQVYNQEKQLLGYIPRYYSEGVCKHMEAGARIRCYVCEVERQDSNCQECIHLEMTIEPTQGA